MLVALDLSFPARKTELAMPWPRSWGWLWGKSRDPQPTPPCSLASEFVHPPNLQQWQSPFPNPFLCEDWMCGTWHRFFAKPGFPSNVLTCKAVAIEQPHALTRNFYVSTYCASSRVGPTTLKAGRSLKPSF